MLWFGGAHAGSIAPEACTAIPEQRFPIEGVKPEATIVTGVPSAAGASDTTLVTIEKEDIEYLTSIAGIVQDMKTFNEIVSLAKGCPDPYRYSD